MLTDELKPCPFCGMQPEDPDVGDYFVECPRCGVQGPVGNEDGRPIAKAEWNRRAIEAEVLQSQNVGGITPFSPLNAASNVLPCRTQNAECATQDGLSLTDATQVRVEALEPASGMSLDDAISHANECSNGTACGTEHRQLARWLAELRDLRNAPQPPAPCPKCADAASIVRDLMLNVIGLKDERAALQDTINEQAALLEKCRASAENIVRCFEAARAEGLDERLAEQPNDGIGTLNDLITRRLSFAEAFAIEALAAIAAMKGGAK